MINLLIILFLFLKKFKNKKKYYSSLVAHTSKTFIPGAKPAVYDKELYKELEFNGETWLIYFL